MFVIIKAKEIATKRTKNRINENGPVFIKKDTCTAHSSLGNGPAVFVVSKSTKWVGWLPSEEIEIEPVKE